jgi:hypothetical protein
VTEKLAELDLASCMHTIVILRDSQHARGTYTSWVGPPNNAKSTFLRWNWDLTVDGTTFDRFRQSASSVGFGVFVSTRPHATHTVALETLDNEHVMCTLVRADPPPAVVSKILPADYVTFDSEYFPTLLGESLRTCHQKVLAFAASEKRSHVMQGPFETVFVTSDIHADLAQFMQVLNATGLVVHDGGDSVYDTVYDRVWTAKWNPDAKSTLLVICGDLVDGKRGSGEVDDTRGSFEFLLHVLLFNLRIEARAVQSDVRFTLGNHDTDGVTAPLALFAWRYATQAHLAFAPHFDGEAKGERARAAMLRPFYTCSPYLLLRLGRAVFVHAGFLSTGEAADLFEPTLQLQERINAETDAQSALVHTSNEATGERNAVWARGYAENEGPCRYLPSYAEIDFIAVGHCITHEAESFRNLERKYKEQCSASEMLGTKDSKEGCVISHDCRSTNPKGPIIAMVDTGSSRCFRSDLTRSKSLARPVGMILLSKESKGPSLGQVDGYFIHRIRVAQQNYAVIDERGRIYV